MAGYAPTPSPVAPHELVRALVALLKADPTLISAGRLGGPHVYAQRQPEPGQRPARFLVVRVAQVPGGLGEGPARAVRVPLQVMAETAPGTTDDVEGLHAALHARAHAVIVGAGSPAKPLTLAHARVGEPVQRRGAPGAVGYDVDDEADYSTARFDAVLLPSDL